MEQRPHLSASAFEKSLPLTTAYLEQEIDEVMDADEWKRSRHRPHPREEPTTSSSSSSSEYSNNQSRLLVLHDPQVTALIVSSMWNTVNYYHLLMDGMLPTAEWLSQLHERHLTSHVPHPLQHPQQKQDQQEEEDAQKRTNKTIPLFELVLLGNKTYLEHDHRKVRTPRIFPLAAAALSSDRTTVIAADGTDQRAHCFCQYVCFGINNLPKFGARRKRGLQWINDRLTEVFAPRRRELRLRNAKREEHVDPQEGSWVDHRLPLSSSSSSSSSFFHTHSDHGNRTLAARWTCSRIRHEDHQKPAQQQQPLQNNNDATYVSSSSSSSSSIRHNSSSSSALRLLYLTRRQRSALNEAAICEMAEREFGFQVVRLDFGSVASSSEQLEWIWWADVIVGVHGMQLTYIAHALNATKLVSSSSQRLRCRTVVELMSFVRPDNFNNYIEIADLADVSFERLLPSAVRFGPSVTNPAREKKLLMKRNFYYWKLNGFTDQQTEYDLKQVRAALERSVMRWRDCCD